MGAELFHADVHRQTDRQTCQREQSLFVILRTRLKMIVQTQSANA